MKSENTVVFTTTRKLGKTVLVQPIDTQKKQKKFPSEPRPCKKISEYSYAVDVTGFDKTKYGFMIYEN